MHHQHSHHRPVSPLRNLSSIAVGFAASCFCGVVALGQSTSDIINDEIASHFNQVFSDETSVYAPERNSWVPGNDKDTQLLGSVWTVDVSGTRLLESELDDFEGHDVNVGYLEAGIKASIPLKPRHKLSLAFRSAFYEVDESGSGGESILEIEEARKIDTGFMYRYGINPRWELLAGGGWSDL